MVLLELQTDNALILAACIWIVAILLGWLADSLMQDVGFGVLGNVIFCALGAFGGLYVLDFLLTYQHLPHHLSGATAWVFAGFFGAAVLVIAASMTKVFVLKL